MASNPPAEARIAELEAEVAHMKQTGAPLELKKAATIHAVMDCLFKMQSLLDLGNGRDASLYKIIAQLYDEVLVTFGDPSHSDTERSISRILKQRAWKDERLEKVGLLYKVVEDAASNCGECAGNGCPHCNEFRQALAGFNG